MVSPHFPFDGKKLVEVEYLNNFLLHYGIDKMDIDYVDNIRGNC